MPFNTRTLGIEGRLAGVQVAHSGPRADCRHMWMGAAPGTDASQLQRVLAAAGYSLKWCSGFVLVECELVSRAQAAQTRVATRCAQSSGIARPAIR